MGGQTFKGDSTNRSVPGIASIPGGPGVAFGSIMLTAGQALTGLFAFVPAGDKLSLWNILFSVVIDDNTTLTANGQFNNLFPEGGGLTAGQRNCRVYNWIDWATSNDSRNQREIKIRIENDDTSTHTYYLYVKAYTYSSTTGT